MLSTAPWRSRLGIFRAYCGFHALRIQIIVTTVAQLGRQETPAPLSITYRGSEFGKRILTSELADQLLGAGPTREGRLLLVCEKGHS
jgi:hypothetical protein